MGQAAQIAVLMTCHNRQALTLACLESLRGQSHFAPHNLFLVDDGSSDGTGEAVRAAMPDAHVIRGDGTLFWNGGMRLAWDRAKAAGRPFDFYLWLNDDVALAPGTVDMLVADADAVVPRGSPVIVSAAACDPVSGAITYGAQGPPDPVSLLGEVLAPTGQPIPAVSVSGNMVLVSAAAEARLGNLRPDFEHIFGDLDYGRQATARGIPVMLASRMGGTCAGNSARGTSHDASLGLAARLRLRWREADSIYGRDWSRFVRLYGNGRRAMLWHRIVPYLRIVRSWLRRHVLALKGSRTI